MAQPRAQGSLRLSTKRHAAASVLDGLRMSGATKALFPRGAGMQALILNTAGGLTGGDRFDAVFTLGAGSHLTVTTQAAERAYRAASGQAELRSAVTVASGASLHWLPQELILFDGCALDRRLSVDLAADARLLLVEPVIFGRRAMGEVLRDAHLRDVIDIRRDGAPLYRDHVCLTGDLAGRLARPAIGGGAGAMACVLLVAPEAEAMLTILRPLLPATCAASLPAPDVLALRLLAGDGHALRQTLLPVLDRLSRDSLPISWRL